jgi:hypothetical protein
MDDAGGEMSPPAASSVLLLRKHLRKVNGFHLHPLPVDQSLNVHQAA